MSPVTIRHHARQCSIVDCVAPAVLLMTQILIPCEKWEYTNPELKSNPGELEPNVKKYGI